MFIYLHTVHEDAQLSQPTITPAKLPQTSNVLSIRKKEFEEWNVPMFISEPFDPKVQPQYCKHKVSIGGKEYISHYILHAGLHLLFLSCAWTLEKTFVCHRAKGEREN